MRNSSNNKVIKNEYLLNLSRNTRHIGRRLALLGIPYFTVSALIDYYTHHNPAELYFYLVALIPLTVFLVVTQLKPRLQSNTLLVLHLISLSAIITMTCGIIVSEFNNTTSSPVYIMASSTSRLITSALIVYFFAAGARRYLHFVFFIPTLFLIIYIGIFQQLDWDTFSLLINPVIVILVIMIINNWETRKLMREFVSNKLTEYQKSVLESEVKEHKEQADKLESQATRDELTNLYNRWVAFSILEKYITNAQEYNTPLTVCFIDVDKLKVVNDTLGHAEGDRLLRNVAHSLREHVRCSDYICRLGGDEFLIIFPTCNLVTARVIVKSIRQDLNANYNIDFSYGFASYSHDDPVDANTLIDTADQNMYKDKMAKKKKLNAPKPPQQPPLFEE